MSRDLATCDSDLATAEGTLADVVAAQVTDEEDITTLTDDMCDIQVTLATLNTVYDAINPVNAALLARLTTGHGSRTAKYTGLQTSGTGYTYSYRF